MIILAFDTATAACSAAILRDGRLLVRRFEERRAGHAERLVPMIEEVVAEAGVGYAELDRIAVTIGPGTFTGVRIGVATARGLALAASRPLVGIGTLAAIAAGAAPPPRTSVLAVMDARRGEVYAQPFGEDGRAVAAPSVLPIDDVAGSAATPAVHLVGDGSELAAPVLRAAGLRVSIEPGPGLPDAAVVARLASDGPANADADAVAPLYLRRPDARLPEKEPRRWNP